MIIDPATHTTPTHMGFHVADRSLLDGHTDDEFRHDLSLVSATVRGVFIGRGAGEEIAGAAGQQVFDAGMCRWIYITQIMPAGRGMA